ncbi:hypothetical protein FOMPIDRAFT_13257, partial [Fomitopsis schrenkii]
VYTHPEVAWVGKTEQEMKKAELRRPASSPSRAKANLDTEGTVKFITEAEKDRILSVHIICPNAGQMVAEATLAFDYGTSSEGVTRTCHAHPTL